MGSIWLRAAAGLAAIVICCVIGIPVALQGNKAGWLLIALAVIVLAITIAAFVVAIRARKN